MLSTVQYIESIITLKDSEEIDSFSIINMLQENRWVLLRRFLLQIILLIKACELTFLICAKRKDFGVVITKHERNINQYRSR